MRSDHNRPLWQTILNSPALWMLVACVPAVIIFANRVLVPDYSTDVISYHLFNGLRAIHHPFLPFLPSEFYPVGIANIAPLYDALTYIARSLVGYRLGTGLSLLAAIGSIWLTYRLLRLMLAEQGKRFHAGWGLLLTSAGVVLELQFQLATYFIDIINACVVLALLYVAVRQVVRNDEKTAIRPLVWAGLWLGVGALLALKPTNSALVVPIAGLLLWDWWRRRAAGRQRFALYLAGAALALLPLLPGWIGNYRLSHNPLFPYYNAVFHSPDYADTNYTDKTFGGTTLAARLIWPAASLSDQLRLGEPHHIYNDYKLITYWVLALLIGVGLLLRRVRLGLTARIVLGYFLSSVLLWGLLFGIERYFISTMLLGGLILAMPFAAVVHPKKSQLRWVLLAAGTIACAVTGIESYRIMRFNLHYDMSWRPPLYQNIALHKAQRPSLFARQLELTPAERQTVLNADIFINCNTNVSGFLSLLPGAASKPTINVIADGLPQYADMSNSTAYRRDRLHRLQSASPGKRTYTWVSVVSNKDIGPTAPGCYRNIAQSGGTVTAYQPINSFLGLDSIHLTLISGEITL